MASLLAPVSPSPALSDGIWRLSVDQYHAMIDAGILGAGSRVELVEGILLEKMSKNPAHSFATRAGRYLLEAAVPAGWFVDTQEPVTLGDSEPEPDLLVARGAAGD
jgi:hypothetical protein